MKLRFRIYEQFFYLKNRLQSYKESILSHHVLIVGIIKPTVLALGMVFLLESIDFFVTTYGGTLGQYLPVWMRLPNWILIIKQILKLDKDSFVELLSVSASIAGAFLALYFTAVSVVVSTVYAKVQGNVRSVVLKDKISNAYVSQVAMLGVVSLLLLSLIALGYLPSFINLTFVLLLGIASFYSFIQLSLRIFYFFDPTHLVDYLTPEILEWVDKATAQGYQWLDKTFQNHYMINSANKLTNSIFLKFQPILSRK